MTPRKSNIELLRILAMCMVMMLHVGNTALGVPTPADAHAAPASVLARIFFNVLANPSVDAFVLISGWFGLRFAWRGLAAFVFQCVFVTWGVLLAFCAAGHAPHTAADLHAQLFVRSWFVQAYLGLYVLAPALNLLIGQSRQRHTQLLLGLFLMEMAWDFLSPHEHFFQAGYSTMHFCLLYLLARHVRLYGAPAFVRARAGLLFVLTTAAVSLAVFLLLRLGVRQAFWLQSYVSPATVFAALCLLLAFDKLRLQSTAVNRVAAASFAVYLLHTNPLVLSDHFCRLAADIYQTWSGPAYLAAITLYMAAWYAAAVAADTVRQAVWRKLQPVIARHYEKRKLD